MKIILSHFINKNLWFTTKKTYIYKINPSIIFMHLNIEIFQHALNLIVQILNRGYSRSVSVQYLFIRLRFWLFERWRKFKKMRKCSKVASLWLSGSWIACCIKPRFHFPHEPYTVLLFVDIIITLILNRSFSFKNTNITLCL